MKRPFLVLLTVCSLLSTLGISADARKLKVMVYGSDSQNLKVFTIDFVKSNPGVTIEPVIITDYKDMIGPLSMKPDVALTFQSLIGLNADMGLFADLKGIVPKKQLDAFMPGSLASCTIGKNLLAIPLVGGCTELEYNTDLFKKAGLSLPSKSWTYEGQFYEACRKLSTDTNGDGTKEGFGFVGGDSESMRSLVYSYGGRVVDEAGKHVNYASGAVWQAARFYLKLMREDLMEFPDWGQYKADDVGTQPFRNGKSAMRFMGSSALDDSKFLKKYYTLFTAGTAPVPNGPKGAIPFGRIYMSAALMGNAQNKSDAVRFINSLSTPRGMKGIVAKTQFLPFHRDTLSSREFTGNRRADILGTFHKAKFTSMRDDVVSIEEWFWRDLESLGRAGITEADFKAKGKEREDWLNNSGKYNIYL